MSIVGPRPEDPEIVRSYYQPLHWETLRVRPGLASPGSIFNYTHGESLLGSETAERDYVERLLPLKLALDVVYVRRASLRYDAAIIARTLRVIAHSFLGSSDFRAPPELAAAERLLGGTPEPLNECAT
jgi:lipopolysaccharide/colanic/teichoic acid biosynthesis glycosyltransferase